MRKTLWIFVAVVFVAIAAPAASADQYTYSFVGACYFAGTNVSFATNGPALEGTDYIPNPGATDEFAFGGVQPSCASPAPIDLGAIEKIYFGPSPSDDCGGSSPCTLELFLVATGGTDGPTFAGLTVPDTAGTYDEFFGNGALTITVATPEPSSLALLLCGLGLLVSILGIRKRAPGVLRAQQVSTAPFYET